MLMEVYGYIYLVRNKVNGKMYFGKTENNFKKRYSGNIAKHTHNEHLKNSINTYGIENFEIVEQFDVAYNEDDLYDLEDMYMCIYNTLDNRYGYNKQRSGRKHKGSGKPSEETKQKMREAKKGKYVGEKSSMYGKTHTKKTKQKMSESHKGEKHPLYGKHHSKETKQKISETRKGKYIGEKNPMYGKTHSKEQKRKNSEARGGQQVICLNTLEVFPSAGSACEWAGVKTGVGPCCKGKKQTAGKHPLTGERLHWMYYSDYLEQQNKNNSDSNNNKVA